MTAKIRMRNQKLLLFSLLIAAIMIAGPLLAFADHGGFHLIECATHYNATGEKVPGMLSPVADNSLCSICDLLKLLEKAFNFIWKFLTVPIATVMLLYGGFLMVLPSFTGNTNQATKGRKVLLNTVIGIAIVFFAWIGVDSILKIMAGGGNYWDNITSVQLGPWNEMKCDEEAARIRTIDGPVDVIPVEFACPSGVTTRIVDGAEMCDPINQRAAVTRGSIVGSGSGQCSPSNIQNLNNNVVLRTALENAATQTGVDIKLLKAMALIESSGNPNAVSPKGACGLVQVLPSTARQSCDWLKNPQNGALAGAQYIRQVQNSPQIQRLGGNQKYILMKYNATFQALEPSNDCPGMVKGECPINPGGFAETQQYIPKVQNCLASLP